MRISQRRLFPLGATLCFLSFFLFLKFHVHSHQLIWDPHNLSARQKTLCFLRTLLPNSNTSSLVYQHLKIYLRKQPDVPIPHFLLQKSTHSSFSECSIVGGSPSSGDPSYSAIIDSAPTIRLNRRYPPFLRADGIPTRFGSRTDFLLFYRNALRKLNLYANGWGEGNNSLGHARFLASETLINEKPVLLFRSRCFSESVCAESLEVLNNSTIPARLPFWHIHHDVEMLARATLKRFGMPSDTLPSIGAVAILVALRMCKRVNLFALSGPTKGDVDFKDVSVWKGHKLNIERKFVHWLSTCSHLENTWCGRVKVFS